MSDWFVSNAIDLKGGGKGEGRESKMIWRKGGL